MIALPCQECEGHGCHWCDGTGRRDVTGWGAEDFIAAGAVKDWVEALAMLAAEGYGPEDAAEIAEHYGLRETPHE